jgi:6-phosphogluconolactonase
MPEMKRRAEAGAAPRFFPVDERKVPFGDAQSNWKACCEELLFPAGLGDQKAHHAVSAAQYEALLRREFPEGPVVFDQVFLGMGEDGHTASLFPGGDYLKDRKSVALDVVGPKPPPQRVTLALKPLWDCKTLVAVALGASKAPMVRRLREADMSLPITLALAGHGDSVLLLDKAAAGE